MKINLHIERLVLDGVPIDRTQGGKLRAAVEQELTRLLTAGDLAPQFSSDGSIPSLRGGNFRIRGALGPTEIGGRIANAVYHGIGGNDDYSPFSFTPVMANKMAGAQQQAAAVKAESKSESGVEKSPTQAFAVRPRDAADLVNLDGGNPSPTALDAPKLASPTGAAWKAGAHVVPTFTVTESEGPRFGRRSGRYRR